MKLFIAFSFTRKPDLKKQIFKLCNHIGFETYLADLFFPHNKKASSLEILMTDEKLVDMCDLILIVFDGAGPGVFMEFERARTLNKKIIAYRSLNSLENEDFGSMELGAWDSINPNLKANSLSNLKTILRKIYKNQ